jgi:hypothetical protein
MGIARRACAAVVLAGALALAGGTGLRAQDSGEVKPEDLFASAKSAFGEKKYGKALSELNLLVGAVMKLRIGQIKTVLPDAPAGWKAEDPTSDSGAGFVVMAGVAVHRDYEKPAAEGGGDPARVNLEIVSDSPLVGMVAPLFSNPAMVQAQEGMSLVTLKDRRAILEWHKESKSGSLKLLLGNNTTLLTLSGSNVQKADLSDVFGKALDIAKIEKVLAE